RFELIRDLRVPLPNIVVSDKILNLDQADLFVFYDRAQLSSPFPTVTLNAVGLGFRMNRGDHFIGRIELGVPINTRKFPDTDPVQFFGSLTVKI
ncbi:MAG: hypothetical protein O7C63_06910, partial [Alphaproteobacteria bacterium]|nr:hypothetical protein [Alphaproteobacteria bacterium]